MDRRPESWSTDITDINSQPHAISRWSTDSEQARRELREELGAGGEMRTSLESRPSIRSTWSRTTAAGSESDMSIIKGSDGIKERKLKVIDTAFMNDDWESLMQDAKYRESIYFEHCRTNDFVALRYLMLSFPDSFVTFKTKRNENGVSVAAAYGSGEVVAYLIKKGADINHADKDGRTPLMLASLGGHYATVELLLSRGADTTVRDRKGQTALHFALPYVSGAKSNRKSLDLKKGGEGDEERANIAIRLLRHNLEHHPGEDHLGQNYLTSSSSTASLDLNEKGGVSDYSEPPPDGGRRAWLQVLGAFLIYFNTAGISSSFGVYQTFYPTGFGLGTTEASLIGSAQSFLLLFTSVIGGPLYDAGLYKYLLLTGASLVLVGTFSQSLSSQFYQLFLSQGVAVGFGGGLFGFLGPTVLSTYFTTKLPLASGIGALGGGVAGIAYPILFRNLQPMIGFGWTVRVFSFVVGATLAITILVLKPRKAPAGKRVFFDPTAFKDYPYMTFVVGNFMINLGLYVPFSFIPTFAKEHGLADDNLSLYLIAILNVGSLFGRVLPTLGATRTGPLNMIILAAASTAIFGSSLLAVNSLASLLLATVMYGFSTGAYFALQPVTLISLCPDPSRIGSRVGMASAFLAFGALPTSTVASALLTAIGFEGVWLWCGITTGLGGVLMTLARVQKVGLVIKTRI